MKTFALGYRDGGDIAVWARPLANDRFECLNGAWHGTFRNDMVFVQDSTKGIPAVKLWEGEVPEEFSGHYNAAIDWIKSQLQPGPSDAQA